MHGTTAQRRYQPHTEGASVPYWGWSHRNQRMEFMDLPSYVDSMQQGYNAAFGDLLTRAQQLGWPAPAATASTGAYQAPAPVRAWREPHEHDHHEHDRHEHDHHEHGYHEHGTRWRGGRDRRDQDCDCERDRDCGCGRRDRDCGCEHRDRDCGCGRERDCGCGRRDRDCGCGRERDCGCGRRDCRCDCCIVDADIIVYAHCGEVRVVPIEVANDSRKIREDVDVEVSPVRSAGGKVLAWPAVISPKGPLTLQPCSTTRLDLTVHVACECDDQPAKPASGRAAAAKATPADAFTALTAQRENCPDVDQCEVGYTTIRLGGCLVRPIVVAIAALPLACDSFRVGCACSSCC
jgi:hypothetical protein